MFRPRVLFIFGTRPEAIKVCPVIRHFRDECDGRFDVRICVTAQHRAMLDQVLDVFGVEPHYDLNAMRQGQTLTSATSRILSELEPVLRSDRPDLVLVQGDTATTLCRSAGCVLCQDSGRAYRGRFADRRYGPAVSGRDESRGRGPSERFALRRHSVGGWELASRRQ